MATEILSLFYYYRVEHTTCLKEGEHKFNNIKSVTVLKMEVPCCNGIANAVREALIASGKMIPWNVVTISTEGDIIED